MRRARRFGLAVLAVVWLVLGWAVPASAAGVEPSFAVGSPGAGPFPSDLFTVPDATQRTGLRVNLPDAVEVCHSDALPPVTDWRDLWLLNRLDGFNVQPRVSIPFQGDVDRFSVSSDTVFLVEVGGTAPGVRLGTRVGVNQVVWDPATRMLHLESDELLRQDTRYLIVVTRGVRDAAGDRIERSATFARFRHDLAYGQNRGAPARDLLKAYRKELIDALEVAESIGIAEEDVAVASVFTTMSVTALLEQLHAQVRGAPAPDPADLHLAGANAPATVFSTSEIASLSWTRARAPANVPATLELKKWVDQVKEEVGQIAFGRYVSPSYLDDDRAIAMDERGVPSFQASKDVYFNLFVPDGDRPPHGWPVVLFGHGQGNNKNELPFAVAGTLARHGLATVAINIVSHGFAPEGTITATVGGMATTFPAGGRAIDQSNPPDGIVGGIEGYLATGCSALLANSHTRLQTVVDLVQLVRVIERGVDLDGDSVPDLDASRIYMLGHSAGSYIGTALAAVEPAVQASALVATLANVSNFRIEVSARGTVGAALRGRTPSLLNANGKTALDGVPVSAPFFEEDLPFRDEPPEVLDVPGAAPIQEFFERFEWATETSAPQALARHLRREPLPGVVPGPVLLMFARGDRSVPTPNTSAVVRAGDLFDRTSVYRHDLLRNVFPDAAIAKTDPHRFLVAVTPAPQGDPPEWKPIAALAQEQVATFFETDGSVIVDPDGAGPLFEVPPVDPIPEELGFITK